MINQQNVCPTPSKATSSDAHVCRSLQSRRVLYGHLQHPPAVLVVFPLPLRTCRVWPTPWSVTIFDIRILSKLL